MTLEKRMLAHGFKLIGTGGNCTAYVRNDGEIEEWVTVQGEPSVPTKQSDAVLLVTGTEEEIGNGDGDTVDTYTFGDVLDALENPDDEYHLLSLRLHNAYHTTRRGHLYERPSHPLTMRPAVWKWRAYEGIRIVRKGWRTSIDLDLSSDEKAYGYVWPVGDSKFAASWEYLKPGEVLDKDLGPFHTARAAKLAVQDALVAEYR